MTVRLTIGNRKMRLDRRNKYALVIAEGLVTTPGLQATAIVSPSRGPRDDVSK